MDLTNTAAIVTGARSGLGAATAKALSDRGVRVFGLDLSSDTAGDHDAVTYLPTDVTNEAQVRRAVEAAAEHGPLRTVVNCAGIAPSSRIIGRNGAHNLALFSHVIQVNLVGTFTVLALASEAMAKSEPLESGQRGVIINTASVAAFEGQIGQAAYSSSKGGVVGLTLPAARDLAQHGIRVNTIAPGIVDSPMLSTISEEYRESLAESVPFPRRLCRPEEFAQLAIMLIEHDYLNGETIRMDGALRMAPR